MKKDSLADSIGYIAFKTLGPLLRLLPLTISLYSGRLIGEILYAFDLKHKSLAYANIKTALGNRLPHKKLKEVTKKFYRNFGQSLIEVFLIPRIDKEYINKYIAIEGVENVYAAFKKGKGVILLGVHAGSWELANIVSANLGFPFNMFVREQRHPRMEALLNFYRTHKGCKLIRRKNEIAGLIEALRNNEGVGMTADQGGKSGLLVDFFGKQASMPTGAIRMALKHGAVILPVYFARIKAARSKIIVAPPLALKETGNFNADVKENLKLLTGIFEKLITAHPADYLWTYKIWKYSGERQILILSDGKVGHLRQAQALARIAEESLRSKEIRVRADTVEVRFKNRLSRAVLCASSGLAGKYHCQGCLWCLKTFLSEEARKALLILAPDVIISCGSSVAPVNYCLARENLARSVVIMRPSYLSFRRFDLVVIPRHDSPPKRKNIVITEGALNLIDDAYLKEQGEDLKKSIRPEETTALTIGLLLGGNTKDFSLDKDAVRRVIRELKSVSERVPADILVTTSRRTPKEIEELVKEELKDHPNCKLLIIANEKNHPSAVGGILAFSTLVVVSPESISMVSEAASSGKYTVVFSSVSNKRHTLFLKNLADKGYIYRCEPDKMAPLTEKLLREKPAQKRLADGPAVSRALERIL
jgi:Kdo2-lipid IVA lauroyltransferase/acyltransferase